MQQDKFALNSQYKAAEAIKLGKFKDEIVPIKLRNGKIFDTDEYPRTETNIEKLSTLKQYLKDGTVTAGNASGLNDGAAALTLMKLRTKNKNLEPLARIVSGTNRSGSVSYGNWTNIRIKRSIKS